MITCHGLSGQTSFASGTSETLPLRLPWRAPLEMGSFSVRNEVVIFKFVGKLYRQSDNGLDRSMATVPCHTLNSPISCGARHGSQNGRVSEVPDVYEVCPLKPCKGGIRQRISKRPAQSISVNSEINTPPHTPATKILGESRGPFKKGSFGGCRAEPCLRPRHDTSTPPNPNLNAATATPSDKKILTNSPAYAIIKP